MALHTILVVLQHKAADHFESSIETLSSIQKPNQSIETVTWGGYLPAKFTEQI